MDAGSLSKLLALAASLAVALLALWLLTRPERPPSVTWPTRTHPDSTASSSCIST
jgi:hypothetical protein